MKYAQLFSLLLILTVCGCASSPTHLIIAPDLMTQSNVYYHNKQATLSINDMRTAAHIVQIMHEDEAATLFSSDVAIENTIKQTLTTAFTKQGLKFSETANNKIRISIDKAIISVSQNTLNYQSQTEIILTVSLDNGEQTLTTTFNNRGNSKGPFKADIAVLERNFNQRLANLLSQILISEQLHAFTK